jgi:hypothetical protein
LEDRTLLSVFTVNSPDDVDDGGADPTHTSFREAINAANANVGVVDRIEFNIPGGGAQTIRPLSELPVINEAVVIDGYTQPGAAAKTNPAGSGLNTVLTIELDGSLMLAGAGLRITGSDSTICGLAINGFAGPAIMISGGDRNAVEGCFIGTNLGGTAAQGNGRVGVWIAGNSTLIGATEEGRAT